MHALALPVLPVLPVLALLVLLTWVSSLREHGASSQNLADVGGLTGSNRRRSRRFEVNLLRFRFLRLRGRHEAVADPVESLCLHE